jgi:hypothetical protein
VTIITRTALRGDGESDRERRAAARRAGNRDRPAERLDTVGQAEDAGAATGIDATDAIVANLEGQDASSCEAIK